MKNVLKSIYASFCLLFVLFWFVIGFFCWKWMVYRAEHEQDIDSAAG